MDDVVWCYLLPLLELGIILKEKLLVTSIVRNVNTSVEGKEGRW